MSEVCFCKGEGCAMLSKVSDTPGLFYCKYSVRYHSCAGRPDFCAGPFIWSPARVITEGIKKEAKRDSRGEVEGGDNHAVYFFRAAAEGYVLMNRVWDACAAAGVDIPGEVIEFFGQAAEFDCIREHPELPWGMDKEGVYWEIDMSDPSLEGVTSIRIYK